MSNKVKKVNKLSKTITTYLQITTTTNCSFCGGNGIINSYYDDLGKLDHNYCNRCVAGKIISTLHIKVKKNKNGTWSEINES